MLKSERFIKIRELLSKKGCLKLKDVVEALKQSESTIRRDFDEMEAKGLLKRVRGGVCPKELLSEESLADKIQVNMREKKVIASYASSFVRDGMCLYLDAGSTIQELIPHLQGKNIIVVTNGTHHMEILTELEIETYLIGGKIKKNTKALVGVRALKNLESYNFDLAFLGVNGITLKGGMTTPDVEEATIKAQVLEQSKVSYFLADKSKFGQEFFCRIAPFEGINLIIDSLPEEYQELRAKINIKECRK